MLYQVALYVLLFLTCAIVLATVRLRSVRQAVLLAASYALYLTWVPWFAAVLFASATVNFMVGEWLRRNPSWLPLSVGVSLNLALLGGFKYLPEFAVHSSLSPLQRFSHLALPLGISFWTFQALSYLFDLYRGEELDPSFFEFNLYMVFFPITISGPVCRMPDMLPQFRSEETTSQNDISEGVRRIAIGVLMMQFAKLLGQGILAGDGIASGFDRATRWSGADVWCLAFGYGLQLFFNFAGYTHLAIGAAKSLGITVPENFERPFAATSPSVFWTRWHMSLSFWIRDYVFLPLAMAHRGVWWRNLALLVSMVIFGLWHKASLLFLIWGSYHGVLLVVHRQLQQLERRFDWEPPARLWTPLAWIMTAAFVSLGWIFFRGNSLPQVSQMLSAIISPTTYSSHFLSLSLYLLVSLLTAGYALHLLVVDLLDRYVESTEVASGQRRSQAVAFIARWRWFWIPPLYVLVSFFLLILTRTEGANAAQFMYRNF